MLRQQTVHVLAIIATPLTLVLAAGAVIGTTAIADETNRKVSSADGYTYGDGHAIPPGGVDAYDVAGPDERPGELLFSERFESGLGRWELYGDHAFTVRPAGDAAAGHVFVLTPGGDAYALIRGSDQWRGVVLEGRLLFPTDGDAYLGIVYDFQRRAVRTDFGVIYVKGNGGYLQVNPHRDFNVGRTLYPEYHVDLTGAAAIAVGRWQRFRAEIIGNRCHVYVGDGSVPQLTFAALELDHGAIGLQPRSVGGEVWVDDITVRTLDRFSYDGPPRPPIDYHPEALLTDWHVLGPLPRTEDDVARRPQDFADRWRAFATDPRGAVVTARVVDYHGPETVAYFRTVVTAAGEGSAVLALSTVDDLALWVNGRFHWFIPRARYAWYDFPHNSTHAAQRIPIALHAGRNEIVVRTRGGVYASGGFFAALQFADAER
jgi:hypothetical protein